MTITMLTMYITAALENTFSKNIQLKEEVEKFAFTHEDLKILYLCP